jgi:hypothetical protein
MAKNQESVIYFAVYANTDDALADLDAIEHLHEEDLLGTYDAAVIIGKDGQGHIVKRTDRPYVRIIPEVLGFGRLPRKELKEAAAELASNQAGLIVVGEPTLEKGFDKAVARATKIIKRTVDATTDQLAEEMKEALES